MAIKTTKWINIVCCVSVLLNVFLMSRDGASNFGCQEMLTQSQATVNALTKRVKEVKTQLAKAQSSGAAVSVQKKEVAHGGDDEAAAAGNDETEKPDANDDPVDAGAVVEHVASVDDGGKGTYKNENGWVMGLELKASRTDNTVFDPKEEEKVHENAEKKKRYAVSPVPKGSWKVRVDHEKWITMDEVAFAYDVWYEENQIFQYSNWMGVFCQQDPSDAFAIQDMLWRVKPDLVVEVGTNTGGGAIFYSTIMRAYNPKAKVVTLDVKHVSQNWNKKNNARCIGCVTGNNHPFWNDGGIEFIQGDIEKDKSVQAKVEAHVKKAKTVLVVEDASHRYPDTLKRMNVIYKYVTPGSYMLVQDTKMDRFVAQLKKRYGNLKFGPMRAVDEFVAKHPNFVIDRRFEYFLYSQHHRGFLKRES